MKSRNLINGLLAASLITGIAACSSTGESYKPGTYATGLLIDGYVPPASGSAVKGVGFSSAPELVGVVALEVADTGDITGTLTIESLLSSADGPGEYDITGSASGTTYSWEAGDYTSTGTITSEGTLEGDLTGPGDQTGIVVGLETGSDAIPVCGNVYWSINTAPTSTFFSDAGQGIMFGAVYGSKIWGIGAGQDFFATLDGDLTENTNVGFYDPAFTLIGEMKADEYELASVEPADVPPVGTATASFAAVETADPIPLQIDYNAGFVYYMNSGFIDTSAGVGGTLYGNTGNCPGLPACPSGVVTGCGASVK